MATKSPNHLCSISKMNLAVPPSTHFILHLSSPSAVQSPFLFLQFGSHKLDWDRGEVKGVGVHMEEMRGKRRERKEKTLYLLPAELVASDQREEEKNKKPVLCG